MSRIEYRIERTAEKERWRSVSTHFRTPLSTRNTRSKSCQYLTVIKKFISSVIKIKTNFFLLKPYFTYFISIVLYFYLKGFSTA